MRKKFFKFIKYTLLLLLAIYLLMVFIPRTYDVPHIQQRESTQYWELPTGSKIAYTLVSAIGTKKPNPIFYLQGGPGGFISDRNIKILTPLSEDGYDIYLYDQIGSGRSERLSNITDYTADRHKKDLEEIIKKTGADKVIIIGQSWGAILATLFIADNPDKVEKVIFTGPGSIRPLREELLNTNAPDSLNLRNPPYSNRNANDKSKNVRINAITFWAKSFGKKLASDKEADDFQTYLNSELNKATVCNSSKALKSEAGGGFYVQVMTVQSLNEIKDPRPKLKDCKIPILIMKGQCDNQPWGFVNEYLEIFPNHQLKIIPDAGHSISVEQPEVYLKTIREFLNQ
ncbi:MAG: alpha/beta hydrolase [Saprospiraceae bacterium]|uniref:Alpha/beta hydrolase n=1 Tax=Candidatus Opimibacter skivensis TaxID=2982028 RepID=A0A9D7XV20_9BACT|nr:alpha/beta hydrolase [Candidatus Opimibacter skivensis]